MPCGKTALCRTKHGTVGAKIKGIPKGIPLIFVSHSRIERMIFHEVKGRCESVCTNVHTCRLRSRATQCRESSISARQKTRTNSIKADLYGLFCLFHFCVGLEPFEHRYARRTSSHFCLVAKPLHAVITTAPPSQEQARIFALRQNRSMP